MVAIIIYKYMYRGKMVPSELYKEIESAKSKVRIHQINKDDLTL